MAEEIFFQEEKKNEFILGQFRAGAWITVGSIYLIAEYLRYHALTAAPCIAITWGIMILILNNLLVKKRYHWSYPYLNTFMDITVFMLGRHITRLELLERNSIQGFHQLYSTPAGLIIFIAMNAMRFSWMLTFLTTTYCTFSYSLLHATHGTFDGLCIVDIGMMWSTCLLILYAGSIMTELIKKVTEREMLTRFLPAPVASSMGKDLRHLELGGELIETTILFAGLKDFSTMTAGQTAEQTVKMLNEYFEEMSGEIFNHRGVLDKYIGDLVCASFSRQFAGDDHADMAVGCADSMLRCVKRFNAVRAVKNETPLRIGIGLHTGYAVAGNIGSEKRLDYTHIGDTVNISSRICGIAKVSSDHAFLISESTFRQLSNSRNASFSSIGPTPLKGKPEPLILYTRQDAGDSHD